MTARTIRTFMIGLCLPVLLAVSSAAPAQTASLGLEGLHAPAVFNGPIDNVTFRAYVDQVLVPTLRPGDVIVLDNLKVHHQPEVRAAIEATGASLRFLPPTVPISIRSSRPSRN